MIHKLGHKKPLLAPFDTTQGAVSVKLRRGNLYMFYRRKADFTPKVKITLWSLSGAEVTRAIPHDPMPDPGQR